MAESTALWLKDHSLLILLLIGTAFNVLWLRRLQGRLRISWPAAVLISALHTTFGVLCVKAFAFLETGDFGNMSLFGGLFFMPALYFLGAKLTKRSLADVLDIFSVCMIFTLMCARINCILSGCCKGLPVPGMQMRFPTRELEILYYIVMLAILVPKVRKQETGGEIYPLYMATYGAFRFFIEFFRVSSSKSVFHLAHLWAALAFTAGLSLYEERKSQNHKKHKKRGETKK